MNFQHKYLIPISILICFLYPVATQAQNVPNLTNTAPTGTVSEITPPAILPNLAAGSYNYFREYTPLIPINSSSSITESTSPDQVQITTTFKDGYNNPIEQVVRNFTSNQRKHLITPFDHKVVGGKSYSFLPYARDIDLSALQDPDAHYTYYDFVYQKDFYNELYPGEGYTSYTAVLKTSDANSRKTITYLPGKSQVGQMVGTTHQSITNDANTIKIWILDANGLPFSSGTYPANELFGDEFTNPDGENGVMFNDKDGHLIYKRIKVSSSPLKYAETYYVYGIQGRLFYTIPPKAVEAIGSGSAPTTTALNNLCFQYGYDSKGRLNSLQHPGQDGKTFMVYDRFQRLVMRQTPNEAFSGQWEVLFYDKMGRVIATSLFTNPGTVAYWQEQMDTPPANPATSTLAYYLATPQGEGQLPGENTIPGNNMMTYSYYDDYSNTIDYNGSIYNMLENQQVFQNDLLSVAGAETQVKSSRLHNMLTGTKVRILKSGNAYQGIGDWRQTVYYFDDKGRTIAEASFNKASNQGQADFQSAHFVNYQYNFSDNVLIAKHTSINNLSMDGNNVHVELIKPDYEPATGRLLKISHKVNNGGWIILEMYTYDELGRPKRQVLGNYGEVRDLNYNIRGQLTAINGVYAESGNKQGQSRSFGQSIKYDYGFSNNRKDGKIAGMVWRGSGGINAKPMTYGYTYDEGGRLKAADFREMTTGGAWSNTATDFSVSNLRYDLAGNMLSMKQRGMVFENGATIPKDIDRLNYKYNSNSNQLSAVEDTVTQNYDIGDFVNNNVNTADYKYDHNGNLTGDLNKNINYITYNHMDKPAAIVFLNGNRIEYSYDAEGSKLEEVVMASGTPTKRTDYIGNFVYKNDSLQYLNTSTGRTVFNHGNGTTREEFFVKDYLGNVRSVVDVKNWATIEYLATYELASANIEGLIFENLDDIREQNPQSPDPGNMMSGRLNGNEPERRVGTSLLLKVMAGDKVEMNVNSFYESFDRESDNPVSGEDMLLSVIEALTSGGTGGFDGSEAHDIGMVDKVFTPPNFIEVFNNDLLQNSNPDLPKAHLNYILFDERFNIVQEFSGAYQTTGDNAWATLGTVQPMEIPANGYLAVYLDNRSGTDVFFDQLSVRFTTGKLKEENHYYPYGLPMGNMGSVANGFVPNRARYQGNDNNKDLGLHLMDFNFRQYDAQIGRFTSVDPLGASADMVNPYAGMNNDPVNLIDPLGLTVYTIEDWSEVLQAYFGGQMDEVVIHGTRPPKIKPNPGGGRNMDAPYDPGKNGSGSSPGKGGSGHAAGPHAGGGGGSADGNGNENAPSPTPGSPTGTKDGITGGGGNGTNKESIEGAAQNGTEDGVPNAVQSEGGIQIPISAVNYLQTALEIAGSIPGLEAADALNAVIYLARGDKFNAAMSLGSMIPAGGYIFNGLKAGKKLLKGSKTLNKTSGWVKRSAYKSLDPAIQKKVSSAIKNGIVAPKGKQGIIKLTATEAAETGYQYKVKILGKGGDIRIYGNPLENGHIFFDHITGH